MIEYPKLFIGPMTKNVVDTILEFCEKEEENIQSEEKKIEVSIMPAQELLEWPKCIDLDA